MTKSDLEKPAKPRISRARRLQLRQAARNYQQRQRERGLVQVSVMVARLTVDRLNALVQAAESTQAAVLSELVDKAFQAASETGLVYAEISENQGFRGHELSCEIKAGTGE